MLVFNNFHNNCKKTKIELKYQNIKLNNGIWRHDTQQTNTKDRTGDRAICESGMRCFEWHLVAMHKKLLVDLG